VGLNSAYGTSCQMGLTDFDERFLSAVSMEVKGSRLFLAGQGVRPILSVHPFDPLQLFCVGSGLRDGILAGFGP